MNTCLDGECLFHNFSISLMLLFLWIIVLYSCTKMFSGTLRIFQTIWSNVEMENRTEYIVYLSRLICPFERYLFYFLNRKWIGSFKGIPMPLSIMPKKAEYFICFPMQNHVCGFRSCVINYSHRKCRGIVYYTKNNKVNRILNPSPFCSIKFQCNWMYRT